MTSETVTTTNPEATQDGALGHAAVHASNDVSASSTTPLSSTSSTEGGTAQSGEGAGSATTPLTTPGGISAPTPAGDAGGSTTGGEGTAQSGEGVGESCGTASTPNDDTTKGSTVTPAESDSGESTETASQAKLRNAFTCGNVQDAVQVLCDDSNSDVQILAHVSTRSHTGSGSLSIDKRYVVRVSYSNNDTKDFYVHLAYKLTLPSGGNRKVHDVHLKVRETLDNTIIKAPSGGLRFDSTWKPLCDTTASASVSTLNGSGEVYAHDAVTLPARVFKRRPLLEVKLDHVNLADSIHSTLLTDAYVYQNTAVLSKDTQVSITNDQYNAVKYAAAKALYYADIPNIRPVLTRLAEYSIMHRGIMGPDSGGPMERHYVFRIGKNNKSVPPHCNVHAFVSCQLPQQQGSGGILPGDGSMLAVRPVHAPTFKLSLFLAASCSTSARTSAEKQQFTVYGGTGSRPQITSEQGGDTQPLSTGSGDEGNQFATGTAQSGTGQHEDQTTTCTAAGGVGEDATGSQSPSAAPTLPIIVVNDYEQNLAPIGGDTPQHVVQYLQNVIKGHVVSPEMNEALVESLVRISSADRESLKRADAGFAELLKNNSVLVNQNTLTATGSSSSNDGNSALSALRGALNWKSGTTDLLLRAAINTCDTIYNGFTVVNSDGTLNRIQPVIKKQVLDLKTDDSTTPGSKVEIARNLQLSYEIGNSTYETSVETCCELSLDTREDGCTKLAIENIRATAAPISGTESGSPSFVAPTTLSYSWCKNEVVSDLSQLAAVGCTPSLAVSACMGQHGLESVFLPVSGSRFTLTRSAAKKSISQFYSDSGTGSAQLGTISNQVLRTLGLQLFRRSGSANILEISRLLSAVSKHLAATVQDVTKTPDTTCAISGRENVGVIAGTRVQQKYRMSMQSGEDILVQVEYDVLLVESGFTDKNGLTGVNTDYVVCNLKVGCAVESQASSISMMEFPVPMMTVLSQQRAVSPSVAAAAKAVPSFSESMPALSEIASIPGGGGSSVSTQSKYKKDVHETPSSDTESKGDTNLWLQDGKFRNENNIVSAIGSNDLLRRVLFPREVNTQEYTSHVISHMAQICLDCSDASSILIENISSSAEKSDPQGGKSYTVRKAADVSVAGSSDVLSVSVEYKVSKAHYSSKRRSGGIGTVCAITDAKLTIKQLDADGAAQASATFTIPKIKSKSVFTPYSNAKIECVAVQQHQEAEPVQQHQEDEVLTTPKTREEEVTAERKAGKWVEETVFIVESSQDDSKKKKRCFIVVWFWWFVGLLAQLWAYIVAAALWCYNLVVRCCCGSSKKVDNTGTVNLLRDSAALQQRIAQQPNARDSGVEKSGDHELLQGLIYKEKRCFIVVWFWWFVGLLTQLWAYIVAAALWCYNLIVRCCCGSSKKVDSTGTVNLRDFATLQQRIAQQPNTRDSGVEKFVDDDKYARLLQSPIGDANETQKDMPPRAQEDVAPPLAAVVTPEVQSSAPGSVLDDGEVANAIAYNYSSTAVGA